MKKFIGFIILLILVICGAYRLAIYNNKQINIPNKLENTITRSKNGIINRQKSDTQGKQTELAQSQQEQQREKNIMNQTPKPIEALNSIVGTYTGSNGTLTVMSTYFSLGVAANEIQVNKCTQIGNTFNIIGENPPYAGNDFKPSYFTGSITKNSDNTLTVSGFGPCDGTYQKNED